MYKCLEKNNIPQENKNIPLKDRKSYLDASPGERAAVTVAGPLANFVLAIFVYFLSRLCWNNTALNICR